jgi:enamine deaminase RidA (YjgF/YER057c/UK114 family)
MERKNFTSGAPWEDIVGYCRAVQMGNTLEVTGTVALNEEGQVVGPDDPYLQTKFIIEKIKGVMEKAGFSLADVVRTRIFVTDISRWQEIGKAHGEYFQNIKPATTMVEVSALISPEYMVEIEFSAVKLS